MLLVCGVISVRKLVRTLRYVEKYLIWFFKLSGHAKVVS